MTVARADDSLRPRLHGRQAFSIVAGRRLLSSFLVHSGTLVCMDAADIVARGDLLVRDGRIVALGGRVRTAVDALPESALSTRPGP